MAGALDPDDGGQQLLLGKMLLERGLITPDQLREALVERARSVSDGDRQATPLGGILVRKGYLSDSQLLGLMAEQNGGGAVEAAPGFPPSSSPPVHSGPQLPVLSTPDPLTEGGHLGKYQLVRELGRGGMGVVYEALDTQLNRKVALKLMLTNPNADPKERALEEERFVQEAQLSAKLKHPNIVTVYEAGLLEGRQFLSMEMIEGQAFNDWRKTVTLREQIKVVAEVAGAVHHAHEQGILHRDLKPRNILVTPAGHSYVTDFGLAKSLGKGVHHSLTGSGAVVGTPAYMSPEQAQGLDRVDWRTDIYSLGVILYECMTGRTPFTGESPIEILMKVVKDPVVPPLQLVDAGVALGLDKGIENVCLKALAKKDRDRYVTAQAFSDDLTKWLSGEKVHVVVPKVPGKGNKRVYVLTALLFLALVAGLGYLGFNSAKDSNRVQLELARKAMAEENFSEASFQYRMALAKDSSSEEANAGVKAAQEGMDRKKRESDEKIRAGVIEKFRTAEEATLRAKKLADAEREARSDEERAKLAEERAKADLDAKKAGEEAAKAEADFRKTQSLVVAPPGTGEDAWKSAINLLPLIDPRRNSILGTWTVGERGAISTDRTRLARLEIPFQLPREYDFRTVFERRTGCGPVSVILSKEGGQFRCELGGEGNTRTAFEIKHPIRGLEIPASRSEPLCLLNNNTYTLLVQVRNDGTKAFLDGNLILSWVTNYADLGLNPEWKLRNTLRLGIGSSESETVFRRLELLEISGKGRKPEAGPPLVLRATSGVPSSLKPGLVAEYYLGTNFQSLALRKLDSAIDFRWGEGPGWSGGPVDSFSCRWKGYLHVSRTAKYTFSATADDGVRMFIDDQQVLAGWNSHTEAPRIAEVILDEGYHRFILEYFEQAYLATMVLSWSSTPGQPPLPITSKSFFHSSPDFQSFAAPRSSEVLGSVAGHGQNVTSVAFDPGGTMVAVAGEDRKVRLIDVETRKDLGASANHPSGVLCVAFSPDGKTFATGARDNKVRIWDSLNRTELRTLDGPTAFVQSLAFSPDGKRIVAGSNDRTVRIWDLDSEEDGRVLTGHTGGVESVVYSSNGKRVATGGRDRTVRIWDLATGKALHTIEGHADFVEAVAFSPGGATLASAGWDGLIKLWDVESGSLLKTLAGHGEEVSCVAFSPNGLMLAAGCNDGMIRIWGPAEGKLMRMLPGHTAQVSTLAFGPTGKILVSGSADTTVRFWNLEK